MSLLLNMLSRLVGSPWVQGILKSSPTPQFKSIILRRSAFLTVQLSHRYMTTGKTIALTRRNREGRGGWWKTVFLQTRNGDAERIYGSPTGSCLASEATPSEIDCEEAGWPKQGWRWGLLKHHNSICYLLRILYEPGTIINALLAMPHWILTIH